LLKLEHGEREVVSDPCGTMGEHRALVCTAVADPDLQELGGVLDAQGRVWEGGGVTQTLPSPPVRHLPRRNLALQIERLPFLCTSSSGIHISPPENLSKENTPAYEGRVGDQEEGCSNKAW